MQSFPASNQDSASASRSSVLDVTQLLQDEPMIPPHPPAETVSLPPIRQVFADAFAAPPPPPYLSLPLMSEASRGSVTGLSSEDDDDIYPEEGSASTGPVRRRRPRHVPTLSLSSTSTVTSAPVSEETPQERPKRRRADANQLAVLNSVFAHTFFPSTELRQRLGEQLGMTARSVQIWFQNKRQQWRQRRRQDEQQGRPVAVAQARIAPYPAVPGFVPVGGVPLRDTSADRMPLDLVPIDPNRTVIHTRPLNLNVQPFLISGQPGTPPEHHQPIAALRSCSGEFYKGYECPLTPVSPLSPIMNEHGQF